MSNKNKNFLLYVTECWFFLLFIIIADLASKHFLFNLLSHAAELGENKLIINKFLYFRATKNYGISFSMLEDLNTMVILALSGFVIFLTMAYMIFLCYKKSRAQCKRRDINALVIIVAGGLANFIERFNHGYVSDFIVFKFDPYIFPAFNLADIFISLGAFLFVINGLFKSK